MSLRQPTKTERRLVVLLLGMVFVLGNVLGFDALQRRAAATRARIAQQRAELAYDQAWIEDRALWTRRAEWLAAQQPVLKETGAANVALIESLQKLAAQNSLTIAEQSLRDPRRDAAYQEVSVQLRLVGTLEAVCRWMAAVQQPELFQAVTNFSLKSEGDANKVRCDLTVARWYAP